MGVASSHRLPIEAAHSAKPKRGRRDQISRPATPMSREPPGGNRSAFKKIRNSSAVNFYFPFGRAPRLINGARAELSTLRRMSGTCACSVRLVPEVNASRIGATYRA
jgi:hypothetical protein